MDFSPILCFGPYRLDRESGTLSQGEQLIALRPQVLAILVYFAARPGEVLSLSELQQHAWQDGRLTGSSLRVSIHELRQVLHDDTNSFQYIETVRGEGYRFSVPVTTLGGNALQNTQLPIGRDDELHQLQDRLAQAQRGQRQLVLVSGEAGMGKTTLVEAFLTTLSDALNPSIGWGYCIEHHGSAEAYLPVLQALGDLGQSQLREPLVKALQPST